MSENSWTLKGVDPEVREQATAEAARLGLSVADYLTDIVIRSALVEQLSAQSEAEPTQSSAEDSAIFAPVSEGPESYAVRHRVRGLERRLNAAVHGLDDAVFDLTSRVGEAEGQVADTVSALAHTQQETSSAIAGLQLDLSVLEENVSSLAVAQTQRSDAIDRHLAEVDDVARGAERSAALLADAHEALKHAVADDFSDFAHNIGNRLQISLAEVRLAANEAAEQADAAVAHLVHELQQVREAFDDRLAESAADTRARMQAAFADTAEHLAALAERVSDNERYTNRVTDQLRAQIADVEDGAQTALEETANALRLTDVQIATDLARTSKEQEAALENVRAGLNAAIVAVHEDQGTQKARIGLLDSAIANQAGALVETREALEQRIGDGEAQVRALLARTEADWNQRHNGSGARIDALEQDAAQIRQLVRAEADRVETCTQAALTKLASDIAQGDASLAERLEQTTESFTAQLAQVRGQTHAETNLLREEHAGALARLTLLDGALARLETSASNADTRLGRLESSLAAADPTLASRLGELEARSEAGGEQLQELVGTLNTVATQSEARAHGLEVAIADLRLEQLAAVERVSAAPDQNDAVRTLESRIASIESAQASAIASITAEIARFIDDNDRRFTALEGPSAADRDLAAAFEALRKRVEERIIGVEQRSVRMLEQVADTVAMIEERFVASQREDLSKSA